MPKKSAKRKKVNYSDVRSRLKLKQIESQRNFQKKYPHAHKFLKEKGVELGKARKHSAKIVGAGALTGTLLLAPPSGVKGAPSMGDLADKFKSVGTKESISSAKETMVEAMSEILPEKARPLTRQEEKYLESIFKEAMGISAKGALEGEHLNQTYGYIGAEQHLKRYPGDDLADHGEGVVLKEGIAPGLGAWGYFAPSRKDLTSSLEETEKWYAVAQTLYLPDWNTRQPYLRDWYKYRKVLIVNTTNGNAVVAAIADSGPAAWTGKHFGGSPEVMYYLGGPRYKKGPVIFFFVDDPDNKVPLGPVDYSKIIKDNVTLIGT